MRLLELKSYLEMDPFKVLDKLYVPYRLQSIDSFYLSTLWYIVSTVWNYQVLEQIREFKSTEYCTSKRCMSSSVFNGKGHDKLDLLYYTAQLLPSCLSGEK
jgi:hypothetical protein